LLFKLFFGALYESFTNTHERKVDQLANFLMILAFQEPTYRVTSEALHVTIGHFEVGCVSDLLVVKYTKNSRLFVLVVEDKHVEATFAPVYQIVGELLAIAQYNYVKRKKLQDVFAVQFIGPVVTFYRVKFSRECLESIKESYVPSEETTVSKFPPDDSPLSLLNPEQRRQIIKYLFRLRMDLEALG
jgi:hypothetical protein